MPGLVTSRPVMTTKIFLLSLYGPMLMMDLTLVLFRIHIVVEKSEKGDLMGYFYYKKYCVFSVVGWEVCRV